MCHNGATQACISNATTHHLSSRIISRQSHNPKTWYATAEVPMNTAIFTPVHTNTLARNASITMGWWFLTKGLHLLLGAAWYCCVLQEPPRYISLHSSASSFSTSEQQQQQVPGAQNADAVAVQNPSANINPLVALLTKKPAKQT